MLKKKIAVIFLGIFAVFSLASCGKFFPKNVNGGGGNGATSKYLYVANAGRGTSNGTIRAFGINASTGALTRIGTDAAAGTNPQALVITSSNTFVYAGSTEGIYAFSVGSDGSLAAVAGSPFAVTTVAPLDIAVDPNGNFLYALEAQTVSAFAINSSSGVLTTVTAGTTTAMTGTPAHLTVASNGGIFVSEGTTGIAVFHVDGNGLITGGAQTAPPTVGGSPFFVQDVAVTPGGNVLYASTNNGGGVLAYTVSSSGGLSNLPISSTPYAQSGALGAGAISVDPKSEFVYVANHDSNNISGFAIQSDGSLRQIPNSPFAAGSAPTSVQVETSDKYIFAANGDGTIYSYTGDSSIAGKLDLFGSPLSSGTSPVAIAISH